MEKKLTTTPQDHTTPPLRGTPPQEGNAQAKSSLKSPPATGEKVSKFPFAGGVAGAARRGGLVPKLRFPEFQNAQDWQERTLSEILHEHGLKSSGKEEVFSVSVHKGLINQIEHLGRRFAAASTDHYNRVLPGDIVYTKSPTGDFPLGIIKQSKVTLPVIVSPLYGVFTPETTALGTILDAYFASPENVNNYLSSIVKKGAKNTINITNKTFLSKSLVVPVNKAEQQKIADCLTSLDEVITAEAQKLDALKAHKKGLMQGLFPDHPAPTGHPSAGGEVSEFPSSGGVAGAARRGGLIPKLRFPEFRDSGEWATSQLDSVATFAKGKGISKSDISPNGKLPCIRYGELYTHYNETIDAVISYTNLLPENLVLSQENDVIIPASGETQIDIATASCVLKSGIALGGDLNIIRTEIDGVFLSYYLNNVKKKAIAKLAQGISVVHLYSSQLGRLIIDFPKIAEQQRIAHCLTSLDELIAAQAEKIEALKAQKKGLMQGLFPQQGSSE